jgi:hypothetical protein
MLCETKRYKCLKMKNLTSKIKLSWKCDTYPTTSCRGFVIISGHQAQGPKKDYKNHIFLLPNTNRDSLMIGFYVIV